MRRWRPTGTNTNTEFELRGFNHLALVARDMAETVAWYEDILGMKLVKTLELPGGFGQHFFLDMGNGVDGIAFFYFPNAPEGVKGESLQNRFGITAIGTMNHLAFDVDPAKFDEYRAEAHRQGRRGHDGHQPLRLARRRPQGALRPGTDDGDVFVRSMYFTDPNGTRLEFACWTKTFDESDVKHAPATARTPVEA